VKGSDLLRRLFLVVLALLLAVAAGLAGLIGVAAITERPPMFLLAGLAAFCVVYLLALLLAAPGFETSRRARVRLFSFVAGTAAVVGAFTATALVPLNDPHLPPAPVRGQQFWELPTGSRIAYVRVAAEGKARSTPVIFLHGGPGVPDMAGDASYFGQLAGDGFDVYIYDQVGRGRSARLDDPRAYTLERDVPDLEAIRGEIGAEQIILIGHSYGGMLAAAYAAANPERVARMVLSSPADPSPEAGGASMISQLDLRQQITVYALLLQPRGLLAYLLLQVNPRAAYAFAGDAEMDARFDRVYNRTRPALHCAGKPPGPQLNGLGFYAHYHQQSPASPPHEDFLPALAERTIPTLVIKGRCDYLSWSTAEAYLQALPETQLVYLEGAGHNANQDEPSRYLAALRALLLDQSVPEPAYEEQRPPDDYEGPP
jgi:proline iminopeptidase